MYLGKEGIYTCDTVGFLRLLTISITRRHKTPWESVPRRTWILMKYKIDKHTRKKNFEKIKFLK